MIRRWTIAVLALAAIAASPAAGTSGQTSRTGGTLEIVSPLEPACLNPVVSPCQDAILPTYGVLEGAFKLGPDFTRHPRLVSHVDFTKEPPLTLTYHIRSEARWSDGTPISRGLSVHVPGEAEVPSTGRRQPLRDQDPQRSYDGREDGESRPTLPLCLLA